MTLLSDVELFGRGRIPLLVRDMTAETPTGAVTAQSVKVVFTLSGWAEVQSRDETKFLTTGSILTIPPNLGCSGNPEGWVRTVTFYFRTDYLRDVLPWLSGTHPLVHLLNRALDGEERIGQLQLPEAKTQMLGLRLAQLAQFRPSLQSEFAILEGVSAVFDTVGRTAGIGIQARGGPDVAIGRPRCEVIAAASLMHAAPDYPWHVGDLAQRVALSPSQLTRLFGSQLGLSPAAYLSLIHI